MLDSPTTIVPIVVIAFLVPLDKDNKVTIINDVSIFIFEINENAKIDYDRDFE
jgi:hypothetical protein